jgi:hypothetical protein
MNLDLVALLDPFTIEQKSMGCDGSYSHLCHGEILAPPGSELKIIDFSQQATHDLAR